MGANDSKSGKSPLTSEKIQEAVENAEREFQKVDFPKFLSDFQKAGWSLQYIYLDAKKNRYSIDNN